MEEWEHVEHVREELFENRVSSTSEEDKKYNDLLRELDNLRKIVTDLNSVIERQNETIEANVNTTVSVNDYLIKISSQIEDLKLRSQPSRWSYVRELVLPLASMIGINTPFIILFGIKTGLISVPFSWAVYSIGKYFV